MKSPTILELISKAEPGECPLCGALLPPHHPRPGGRPRKYCADPECARLYWQLYYIGRSQVRGAA